MAWLPRFLRRDIGSEAQYGPIVVKGRQLRCVICNHGTFWEHYIQLHTPFLSFMNWEWLNRTAQCAVCASCGYIHWFVPPATVPQEIEDQSPAEDPAPGGGTT